MSDKIKLPFGKEVEEGDKVWFVNKKDLTVGYEYIDETTVIIEEENYSELFTTQEEAEDWLEKYKKSLELKSDQIFSDLNKQPHIFGQSFDSVNYPKHYLLFPDKDIQVIDVIDVLMDKAGGILTPAQLGYYSQLMGYLMRFSEKGGLTDLKKSKFYLDRIISQLEND